MAERSSAGTDFRFGAELTAPQILIFNTPDIRIQFLPMSSVRLRKRNKYP